LKKINKLLDKLTPSFNVGWASFQFKFKKNLVDGEGSKCYGITDFNEFTITLDDAMPDNVAHPTIIHEVCHALIETLGLGGDHDKEEDLVVSSNEFITEAACRSFLMFKNLNPELWKILFEDYYE
jgi:hypothetical protein